MRNFILMLMLISSFSANAQSFLGCWSFKEFDEVDTGIAEFKLEIKTSAGGKRTTFPATVTITAEYEKDGKKTLDTYPSIDMNCRPVEGGKDTNELNCFNVDDNGGQLRFSLSGDRARIQIENLDATSIDSKTKREIGIQIVAPPDDPYVSITDKRCAKTSKK